MIPNGKLFPNVKESIMKLRKMRFKRRLVIRLPFSKAKPLKRKGFRRRMKWKNSRATASRKRIVISISISSTNRTCRLPKIAWKPMRPGRLWKNKPSLRNLNQINSNIRKYLSNLTSKISLKQKASNSISQIILMEFKDHHWWQKIITSKPVPYKSRWTHQ